MILIKLYGFNYQKLTLFINQVILIKLVCHIIILLKFAPFKFAPGYAKLIKNYIMF